MDQVQRKLRLGNVIEDGNSTFHTSSRSDQIEGITARETPPNSGRRSSYDYLNEGERSNTTVSDDISVGSELSAGSATAASDERSVAAVTCLQNQPDPRQQQQQQQLRRRHHQQQPSVKFTGTINYHGATIFDAASQGNLPLCVLLWGMASSKRVNLMEPDSKGNNPMHFAAVADTHEVMGFLQQQGRSLVLPAHTRLVDSKNDAGETPLLRAAVAGKLVSLKYLLDEGADPFAVDNKGYTIFMMLAKNSHLWCLHYVYSTLSDRVSPDQTFELLTAIDIYGHNALDWAAEAGDVNIIEYLIRKGLEPTRLDSNQRSPLYWACRAGRVAAAQFLVRCDCNPFLEDTRGYCPYRVAVELRNDDLAAALRLGKGWCWWSVSNLTVFGGRGLSSSKISRKADLTRISRPAMMRKGGVVIVRKAAASHSSAASVGSPASSHRSSLALGRGSPSPDHLARQQGLGALLGVSSPPSSSPNDGEADTAVLEEGGAGVGGTSGALILVGINGRGMQVPYALNKPHCARFGYCFVYALIVFFTWILALYIPYFLWLPFVALSVVGYRYLDGRVVDLDHAAATVTGNTASPTPRNSSKSSSTNKLPEPDKRSLIDREFVRFIKAPERYLGMYLGSVAICVFFLACSLRYGYTHHFFNSHSFKKDILDGSGLSGSTHTGGRYDWSSSPIDPPSIVADGDNAYNNKGVFYTDDPFLLGALSASVEDKLLFLFVCLSVLVSFALWAVLVWVNTDPGVILTREHDFDEVMDKALIHQGAPPAQTYCRTTLVKKPLRSKYCTHTGLVVARMDHYCVWLNNAVGFKNHRTFVLFLIAQLTAIFLFIVLVVRAINRELQGLDTCSSTGSIFSTHYFMPATLCLFLSFACMFVGMLTVEQLTNITANITTNERINRQRYPWLTTPSGKPFNRFDRGIVSNILEFWQIAGYARDYFSIFELPSPDVLSDDRIADLTDKQSIFCCCCSSSFSSLCVGHERRGGPSAPRRLSSSAAAGGVDGGGNSGGNAGGDRAGGNAPSTSSFGEDFSYTRPKPSSSSVVEVSVHSNADGWSDNGSSIRSSSRQSVSSYPPLSSHPPPLPSTAPPALPAHIQHRLQQNLMINSASGGGGGGGIAAAQSHTHQSHARHSSEDYSSIGSAGSGSASAAHANNTTTAPPHTTSLNYNPRTPPRPPNNTANNANNNNSNVTSQKQQQQLTLTPLRLSIENQRPGFTPPQYSSQVTFPPSGSGSGGGGTSDNTNGSSMFFFSSSSPQRYGTDVTSTSVLTHPPPTTSGHHNPRPSSAGDVPSTAGGGGGGGGNSNRFPTAGTTGPSYQQQRGSAVGTSSAPPTARPTSATQQNSMRSGTAMPPPASRSTKPLPLSCPRGSINNSSSPSLSSSPAAPDSVFPKPRTPRAAIPLGFPPGHPAARVQGNRLHSLLSTVGSPKSSPVCVKTITTTTTTAAPAAAHVSSARPTPASQHSSGGYDDKNGRQIPMAYSSQPSPVSTPVNVPRTATTPVNVPRTATTPVNVPRTSARPASATTYQQLPHNYFPHDQQNHHQYQQQQQQIRPYSAPTATTPTAGSYSGTSITTLAMPHPQAIVPGRYGRAAAGLAQQLPDQRIQQMQRLQQYQQQMQQMQQAHSMAAAAAAQSQTQQQSLQQQQQQQQQHRPSQPQPSQQGGGEGGGGPPISSRAPPSAELTLAHSLSNDDK